MTTTHMTSAARPALYRGVSHRSSFDSGLLIAVALLAAVVIADAAFIALGVATIPDIGAIFVPVP